MTAVGENKTHAAGATKIDGRWVAAGVVAAFLITVYICGTRTDFVTAWARVGVEHLSPNFADLRFLTSGLETTRVGGDPLRLNAFDPWLRPINYPRIWLALSYLGLGTKHTATLGVLLAAGFYAAVLFLVGRITVPQGLIYAVLLCSPPAMLAVERGNVDLIIFTLLVAAALLFHRAAGAYCYFLITAASMLKLYPMCGFVIGLRERRHQGLVLLALGLTAFALYAYCIRTDIDLMVANTPQIKEISYGRRVLFEKLVTMKFAIPIEFWSKIAFLGSILMATLASLIVKRPEFSSRAGTMMAIGAGIYAGTFVMMNNFNYRLIFLLFLVPQLLEWRARRDAYRWIGGACLVTITGAMLLASSRYPTFFIPKEILNWLIFVMCLFVLICLSAEARSALMGGSIK
jgi:hypothetical protein